jgi:hypothetical protein
MPTDAVCETFQLKDFLPLIQVATGALIGGCAAFFGSFALRLHELKTERRNVASAFFGELIALRSISERRKYIDHIRAGVERIKTTNQPFFFHIRIKGKYFQVYEANIGKMGLLHAPIPQLISVFYTQCQSIMEDMEAMDEGRYVNMNAAESLALMTQLLALFEDTRTVGDKVLLAISKQYPELINSRLLREIKEAGRFAERADQP